MTHVRGILGSALLLVACGDKIAPDDSGPVDTDAPVEDCASGEDEDGDGLTDCEDEDCVGAAPCLEACTGGEDEDLDGLVDCADPDCVGQTVCIEDCTSGADEDRDGLTDCADPECVGIPACLEDCGSLRDEDVDGLIDCADPDCVDDPRCVEDCASGRDEDRDGLNDCEDPDCADAPACQEDCSSGSDEDRDGLTDCEDDDCAAHAACREDCESGRDEDLDGLIDCEDADCAGDPAFGEDCTSGVDDDGDGWTDCEDDDCWGVGRCRVAESWNLTGGRARLVIDARRSTLDTAGWSCHGGLSTFAAPVTDWRSHVDVEIASLSGSWRRVATASGVPVRTDSCGWTVGTMSAGAEVWQSERTCSGGAAGRWGDALVGSVRMSSACTLPVSATLATSIGVGAGFVAAGAVPAIEDYWGFATLLTLNPTASTSTWGTTRVYSGYHHPVYGWLTTSWASGTRQSRHATIDGTVAPIPSWYPLHGP